MSCAPNTAHTPFLCYNPRMANDALSQAKKAKNDEFYTVYHYIQKEINRLVHSSQLTELGRASSISQCARLLALRPMRRALAFNFLLYIGVNLPLCLLL